MRPVVGSRSLGGGRFHDRLATLAVRVFDDAHADDGAGWCTVIAVNGVACEAAAAYALRSFLEVDAQRSTPCLSAGRARRLRELLRSKKAVNLKSKTQRDFWQVLSNDRLTHWADWIRYVRCVEQRDAVLHQGVLRSKRLPGRDDAIEAIEVTRSFHTHLALVMRNDPLVRDLA